VSNSSKNNNSNNHMYQNYSEPVLENSTPLNNNFNHLSNAVLPNTIVKYEIGLYFYLFEESFQLFFVFF
jgi:hypothetical protein